MFPHAGELRYSARDLHGRALAHTRSVCNSVRRAVHVTACAFGAREEFNLHVKFLERRWGSCCKWKRSGGSEEIGGAGRAKLDSNSEEEVTPFH